jgi:hypothetical protein
VIQHGIMSEAEDAREGPGRRGDRRIQSRILGAGIDQAEELGLARQAIDPIGAVGPGAGGKPGLGQRFDVLEVPALRGDLAGRVQADARPGLAAIAPADIVADADLDRDAGNRPAQVVDEPAAEGRGPIEGQVDPDRLTSIEVFGTLRVDDGPAVGAGLVGMDADHLVPGESEAGRGRGDLEQPDLGAAIAEHRLGAELHASGDESAVRPGGRGGQQSAPADDGTRPPVPPVDDIHRGAGDGLTARVGRPARDVQRRQVRFGIARFLRDVHGLGVVSPDHQLGLSRGPREFGLVLGRFEERQDAREVPDPQRR